MKILIAGDYVPMNRIANMIESKDYSFFDNIKQYTNNHDLSIINLEAPIVRSNYQIIKKCGPNLKANPNTIDSIKYGGFNMATLANNHILDYGENGINDTIEICENNGIMTVGAGKNLNDATSIKLFKKKGKTVAIINCCEHEFSIAEENKAGSCPLDPITQFHQIKKAKSIADYVMVIVHGGHEHYQYPTHRMVENYRFLIEIGADAVINHHQHCFSGYEIFQNKPIFYGIGNLCFDTGSNNETWHEGYMVSLNLDKDTTFSIIPYIQCDKEPKIEIVNSEIFQTRIDKINQTLTNKTKLISNNEKYFNDEKKHILKMFEPYSGRICNKLFTLGLLPSCLTESRLLMIDNYISCESHRDKVLHVLKKEIQKS